MTAVALGPKLFKNAYSSGYVDRQQVTTDRNLFFFKLKLEGNQAREILSYSTLDFVSRIIQQYSHRLRWIIVKSSVAYSVHEQSTRDHGNLLSSFSTSTKTSTYRCETEIPIASFSVRWESTGNFYETPQPSIMQGFPLLQMINHCPQNFPWSFN